MSGALPARRALPPFAALRAFDAVARLGGIRKAATMLGVDHTVVSRHVRTLEAWVGISLLTRSPAGMLLTPDGRRYHASIADAIDGIATATLDLLEGSDSGALRIWCMPGFAFQWLTPRIGRFEQANLEIAIEMRPTDHPPDLLGREADVDIRYCADYEPLRTVPTAIRSIELSRPIVVPAASPDYLARTPAISEASDLLDHELVHEESFANWTAWLEAHGVAVDRRVEGHRLWHGHLTVEAARRGRGIALVNAFLAADDIVRGSLIEIGRGRFTPISLGAYKLYAREDRWTSYPVMPFRQWLVEAVARDAPDQDPAYF